MLGLVAMGIGTGISMLSSYREGKAQDAMAKYNAEVAKIQAEAKARAIESEAMHKADVDRSMMASLRAQGASRGVDYESGSPLLIAAQMARENQYDQLEMRRQAQISRQQGAEQATMLRWEGKQARRASLLNMTAQGIKGAGQIYGAYTSTPKIPKAPKMPTIQVPKMGTLANSGFSYTRGM